MSRLANAASPYLRHHAANPVDWWPWCEEAFAEARRRDCPVFLSIGYAACHWCHVMERESFSDPVVGRLLSDGFVSIKVDREERPDVDSLYMEALVEMTGDGGWPASLWLTPDGRPFHAGTYFPAAYRYGTPAFADVLAWVRQSWETGRSSVETLAERTRASLLAAHGTPNPGSAPGRDVVAAAVKELVDSQDRESGGWGHGPRFPQAPRIELLLSAGALAPATPTPASRAPEALSTALRMLDVIDRGALHDHVGGGFHRYTVDADWRVPHFEKMLSDNAQLATAFLHAWSLTGGTRLATVACDTLEYMVERLGHADGGFSSSEDADDAGGEGAYYTWSPAQLREALGPAGASIVGSAFAVTEHGNHETGGSILFRTGDAGLLSAFRARLRAARSRRPAPAVDDKRVVAWNGLAISAFSLAGRLLRQPRYLDIARRTAEACLAVVPEDGRCPRTLSPDAPTGVLDDGACLAAGLLDLYEATAQRRWLDEASRVMGGILAAFHDSVSGALWHSVADPTLPLRRVQWGDGAEPSGAGVAAMVLVRLASVGAPGIDARIVDRLLGAAGTTLSVDPARCPTLLRALQVHVGPPRTLVVTGPAPGLLDVATQKWRPDLLVAPVNCTDPGPYALFAGKTRSAPAAWLCEGATCRLPTRDPVQLADWLGGKLST